MINGMQSAIIKKDLLSIVSNKNILVGLIIVPFVFTVFFPALFITLMHFVPDQMTDLEQVLSMLPEEMISDDINHTIIVFLLDNIMPVFFTIIPIMASTVMAASSFVGEKEKSTLETLLYCPLSLTQIYQAKVWASFFLSMGVTFVSFIMMLITVETGLLLTTGSMILPGLSWLFTLLVVAPAVTLLAITLIVTGSAKAKSFEDAQQRALFLVLPLILVIVGQFTGIILINEWYLLIAGAFFGLIAFFMMRRSMSNISYEALLR